MVKSAHHYLEVRFIFNGHVSRKALKTYSNLLATLRTPFFLNQLFLEKLKL
jgi:hypothetical protein